MRIRTFAIVINDCTRPHVLQNTCLVIDGQNFFYNCYKDSKLRYDFGAECDRYAMYLKEYLSMFKKANIKCYFIFKGGTENLKKKIEKDRNNPQKSENIACNPIFASNIHLEILNEMGFDYVFSEFQAKTDCVHLATKLSCPVLSNDIEFGLSGVPYIPFSTLSSDENKKNLKCKLFILENLLEKFRLDRDKVAVFIVLTDLNIFPEDSFTSLFKSLRMSPFPTYNRNLKLLMWLSQTPSDTILQQVLRYSSVENKLIKEELDKSRKLVRGEVTGSLAVDCILKKEFIDFKNWFEIGVALNCIPKAYIDLYRSNTLLVSTFQDEEDAEQLTKIVLSIIKYAYDLLTNFENDGFMFISRHWQLNFKELLVKDSIKKPIYQANSSVFENGWEDICTLKLFQHFMIEEVNFQFDELDDVPDDAKMLLMSLIYFDHKKSGNTKKFAYGILLSYVILSAVNKNDDDVNFASAADLKFMSDILDVNSKVTNSEILEIKHEELLQPLLEFQLCLRELNNLNKLCGSPFEPTIYSKTYNGTFVYKIVHRMQNKDELQFITEILEPAPTVLNFIKSLINPYEKLL